MSPSSRMPALLGNEAERLGGWEVGRRDETNEEIAKQIMNKTEDQNILSIWIFRFNYCFGFRASDFGFEAYIRGQKESCQHI